MTLASPTNSYSYQQLHFDKIAITAVGEIAIVATNKTSDGQCAFVESRSRVPESNCGFADDPHQSIFVDRTAQCRSTAGSTWAAVFPRTR
ncbi:unnamed protein product [Toxocara canis]|uniref:Sema domain-containing protein n=1 Tax=Toxocara canis TaxID=6265 RepID=A0A183UXC9_TOXCA|nr:unnamed protein product [Toxocara canis]